MGAGVFTGWDIVQSLSMYLSMNSITNKICRPHKYILFLIPCISKLKLEINTTLALERKVMTYCVQFVRNRVSHYDKNDTHIDKSYGLVGPNIPLYFKKSKPYFTKLEIIIF